MTDEEELTRRVSQLMELQDRISELVALTTGYRTQLIEHGYSPDLADMLAAQLHGYFIQVVFL